MTPLFPDHAARRRAASDFEHNLVVRAGAGTGKTELLVERVLTAIGLGRLTVDGLAALTFTEKAAAEMRERVAIGLDRLASVARSANAAEGAAARAYDFLVTEAKVAPAEIASRAGAALEQLDRARITTIHSFCADVLRAFPQEAGVDPGFRIDPGERFDAAFDLAWAQFLSAAAGPDSTAPEAWQRLLAELGAPELRAVARELAAFAFPRALLAREYAARDPRPLLAREVDALLERVARGEQATGRTKTNDEIFAIFRAALTGFTERGPEAVRQSFAADPRRAVRLERGSKPGSKLGGMTNAELSALVSDGTRMVQRILEIDEDLIRRVFEALAPMALAFRESYLAQGLVDFDGLLQLTRELLARHVDVRRAVRRRIQMLVVDEFQDNDPVQYEIVLFLAESDGSAAEDPFAAQLAPGRLFVVGDAKQSIYRFRGADYDAFRRAAERVLAQDGIDLHLTTNFRSVPEVLDAVHRLMGDGGVGWRETAHQPPYEAVVAHRDPCGHAVEVWSLAAKAQGGKLRAGERRLAEGQAIAAQILAWAETKEIEKYSHVTILLRAFAQLAPYLKPLRAAGIPFVVDGGRDFAKRPEVEQLLAILKALDSPSDPIALLAYLRSPAGGVPDTELAKHADARGAFDWRTQADARAVPALAAAFARLRALAAESADLPIDARIRRTIRSLDLLPLCAASFEGAQRVANLRKLAHVASEMARDGTLSLREVLEALAGEQFSKHEADSPLADEQADAVRILTIHKAKGLENERVILADVARDESNKLPEGRVSLVRSDGRLLPAVKAGQRMNAARVLFEAEERRHERAEETRVLYVALTRARSHLAVVVGPPGKRTAWVDALAAWNFDPDAPPADGAALAAGRVLHRCLTPSRAEAPVTPDPPACDAAVAAYRAAAEVARAAARRGLFRPSGDESLTAIDGVETENAASVFEGAERGTSRAVGTVVHALLRRIDWSGRFDLARHAAELAGPAAAEAGADPALVAREAAEVVAAFVRSDLGARLRSATIRGRELPILLEEGDRIWSGTLDLLIEENGELTVVDYKTDRGDPEALVDRYRTQLGIYARAIGKTLALAKPPRTELWALRAGRAVVVPRVD